MKAEIRVGLTEMYHIPDKPGVIKQHIKNNYPETIYYEELGYVYYTCDLKHLLRVGDFIECKLNSCQVIHTEYDIDEDSILITVKKI